MAGLASVQPKFQTKEIQAPQLDRINDVLSAHLCLLGLPEQPQQFEFNDFKNFVQVLDQNAKEQIIDGKEVKVNVDLQKPVAQPESMAEVQNLVKLVQAKFNLPQKAEQKLSQMSEADKIKMLIGKGHTHQEPPKIQAFLTLSQLCGSVELQPAAYANYIQPQKGFSKDWVQSPQFLFSLLRDLQLVACQGCSSLQLSRHDRMNADPGRVIENYMVPAQLKLKRVDDTVVPLSNEFEEILLQDMARYQFELEGELQKLKTKEQYLYVPFELLDVVHFYMQGQLSAKQGLLCFARKVACSVQKAIFVTLLRLNCFSAKPFDWVMAQLKQLYGDNCAEKAIKAILEDGSDIYNDLLPHNIMQFVIQDQDLYLFLLQRVCLAVLQEVLAATPKPSLPVEVQRTHNYLRPHLVLINRILQMISYLNMKLTGSSNPLHVPAKFVSKEFMPQEVIKINRSEVAFDHYFAISLGESFNYISKMLAKLQEQNFVLPRNPIYQAKLDTVLGDFSDFAVYRDTEAKKAVVINPFQEILVIFESQHQGLYEQTMQEQIDQSLMLYSNGFEQWMNLQSACQQNTMIKIFAKMEKGAQGVKIEDILQNKDESITQRVKDEIALQMCQTILRTMSKSMIGCYPTNPAEPYEIQKISPQKQNQLLEAQFSYLKKMKASNGSQQLGETSYAEVLNFTKSLFKYDLMQLGFEFLHTQLRLSTNKCIGLQGLCECLQTVLTSFDMTDDAFGGAMQTFVEKLAAIQKTASNLQNSEIAEIIQSSIGEYCTIFATFEHNWSRFDSVTETASLLSFIQQNRFSDFDFLEQMRLVGEQIDGVFRTYDLAAAQLSRISYLLDDKFMIIKFAQRHFQQLDITDMHMLDALNLEKFPSFVPANVIEKFLEFSQQGQRLQKQVKTCQGITSLQLTAQQQFYAKKRTFWFTVQPNCMECHQFKQAQQNKNLQQTLTANKTRYGDLLFKFAFQKLFQRQCVQFDGSLLQKQRLCQTLLKTCMLLEPFAQKSQFAKQLGQFAGICNVRLDPIQQESVSDEFSQQLQQFAFAFFTFHIDVQCHVFNNQHGAIRQMDCDYKKIQQIIAQTQKRFADMFNASAQTALEETESNTLSNLYKYYLEELAAKGKERIVFSKRDFELIKLEDVVRFQKKNVPVVAEYKELVKPKEEPKPEKAESPAKPEIQGEIQEEAEAKQVLDAKLEKKNKKSKKDKEKEKKEKERKKKLANKKPTDVKEKDESSSEESSKEIQSESITRPESTVSVLKEAKEVEQSPAKVEKQLPKAETKPTPIEVKVDPKPEPVQVQQPKPQPVQPKPEPVQQIQPEPIIDIQVQEEETIDPNAEWTGETQFATKILTGNLKMQKVFNIIPSKIGSLNEQVRQLHGSLSTMMHQLNNIPNKVQAAKLGALFPMNPLDFLTLVNGKQADSMIVSLENITSKLAISYIKLYNVFSELYLVSLGSIVARLDQKYFKVVNIKMDSGYFQFRIKQARAQLDAEGRALLESLVFGFDFDEIYIPFVVGLQADYKKCATYDAVGCNLQWQCGHTISSWQLMSVVFETFQPFSELPNVQFREHFFDVLARFGQICPECNKFGFMQRLLRGAAPAGIDKQGAIQERMALVDENDPQRKVVVEIGGVGYLATIQSCCWINQYVDEWVI